MEFILLPVTRIVYDIVLRVCRSKTDLPMANPYNKIYHGPVTRIVYDIAFNGVV
jgi:hypothetical protein